MILPWNSFGEVIKEARGFCYFRFLYLLSYESYLFHDDEINSRRAGAGGDELTKRKKKKKKVTKIYRLIQFSLFNPIVWFYFKYI